MHVSVVYMCVVSAHVCVHRCMGRSHEGMSGVLLFSPYSLETLSLLELEARLAESNPPVSTVPEFTTLETAPGF